MYGKHFVVVPLLLFILSKEVKIGFGQPISSGNRGDAFYYLVQYGYIAKGHFLYV